MPTINPSRALAFLLALPVACAGSSSSSSGTVQGAVTDTLGLKFDLNCGSGPCVLTPQNSSIVARSCGYGSGTDVFLLVADPLLSVYALHVPTSGEVELNAADPAHPVACVSDAECPTNLGSGGVTNNYTCQNRLCLLKETCQAGTCTPWDGVLLTYDVLALCQADLAWPISCPYITSQPFADRIAEVGDVCGSNTTCAKIPADCRQLSAVAPIDGGGQAGIDTGS